jgi:hypothetical protein
MRWNPWSKADEPFYPPEADLDHAENLPKDKIGFKGSENPLDDLDENHDFISEEYRSRIDDARKSCANGEGDATACYTLAQFISVTTGK